MSGPPQPSSEDQLCGTNDNRIRFGSAHADGYNFAFCDGSVHVIAYSIDPTVHQRLCNRCDGQPVQAPSD